MPGRRVGPLHVRTAGSGEETIVLLHGLVATGDILLVWSAFTTHYLDLEAAAAEFARVLKPAGRLLIWHAFPDVFDDLEWFRWFPTARALDEHRMPSATTVRHACESAGFEFRGRSDHQMRIAHNLTALADRLAHRSISTLRLIPGDDFAAGLAALRVEASKPDRGDAVFAPNVLLSFAVS